jgi:hypothetical protein
MKFIMNQNDTRHLARPMLRKSQARNESLTENIMNTYTKNLIAENGMMVGTGLGWIGKGYNATNAAKAEATLIKHVKNVALFFAAPFIGLAYLLAFPVVGLALLAWIAGKAAMKNEKVRPVAMLIAAPFIAIAFVTVGPIVGLGALAATAAKAVLNA